MSNILEFIRPHSAFDPDTLTILGDVYDRACDGFCSCQSSRACDEMADRIFDADEWRTRPRHTLAERGARN